MDTFLDTQAAAKFLGWQPQTLDRRRWLGQAPRYYRVGRSIRYKLEDLIAFVEMGD